MTNKKANHPTMASVPGQNFGALLGDIRNILAQARQNAYAVVNAVMVESYWQIGRRIVEEEQHGQQRAEYGAQLVKELSRNLSGEFGSGFSVANIKNFRQFYLTYPAPEKSYALRSALSWTHHRLIMRVDTSETENIAHP